MGARTPTTSVHPVNIPTLTYAQVAQRTGLSKKTLYRRVADGTLTAYTVGGQTRFHEADVAAMFTRRAADVTEHVARIVAAAPPLTDAQRAQIAALLGGAR